MTDNNLTFGTHSSSHWLQRRLQGKTSQNRSLRVCGTSTRTTQHPEARRLSGLESALWRRYAASGGQSAGVKVNRVSGESEVDLNVLMTTIML